jgi:hypothetical protein
MRLVAAALLLSACGGGSPALPATALGLHVRFAAPSQPNPSVSLATAQLHMLAVEAVSDRSTTDGRARVDEVDLAMAGASDTKLTGVAPALYSGVAFALGNVGDSGVDLTGAVGTNKLHATLSAPSVYVSCDAPLTLDPGGAVQLTLSVDPTHWFDGIDLSTLMVDSDDNGIILSSDDNADTAALLLGHVLETFQLACSAG